jgi:putative transposase
MSRKINKDKLQALANELAKDVKTPEDLNNLSTFLTKLTVEAALKVEMDNLSVTISMS